MITAGYTPYIPHAHTDFEVPLWVIVVASVALVWTVNFFIERSEKRKTRHDKI